MPRQLVKLANKHFEIDLKNAFPPLFSDTILIILSWWFFRTTPGNSWEKNWAGCLSLIVFEKSQLYHYLVSEILTEPAHWKYPQKNLFETSHRSDCSRTSDTRALLYTSQIGRCRRCSLSLPPSPGTDDSSFMAYNVLQNLDTSFM